MATRKAVPKGSWVGADGRDLAHWLTTIPPIPPLPEKLDVSDFERLEKGGLIPSSRSRFFHPNSILDQTKTRGSSNLSGNLENFLHNNIGQEKRSSEDKL